jgi:hypothetical protein
MQMYKNILINVGTLNVFTYICVIKNKECR